uniref:FG-GAP repeat protein n=1 Tax=Segetibacter koreensis TaxID=398037 RepID=UPI000527A969
ALPAEAQFSPMYGIAAEDFDKDGKTDIIMGGNFYESKPEVGIYDASYGVFLKGNGKGSFTTVHPNKSGFFSVGAIRDIRVLKTSRHKEVLIVKNNDKIQIVQY